jgi:thymidylate synthase
MKQYLDILRDVVENGRHRGDRTGTGTTSIFDARFKHDMRDGFPLITTKRTFLRGVFWELMGFLNNDLHMQVLVDENVKIWDGFRLQEPADIKIENSFARRLLALSSELGDALPVTNMEGLEELMVKEGIPTHKIVDILPVGALNAPYGAGWRAFKTANGPVDQFSYALDLLRHNPESRRILVSAWNPGWMPEETRQVPLTFDERYALFAKDHPDAYEHCETLMSYPEYQGDLDAAIHQMDEANVPVYKTVKVTPQDNIANDKPCLTPCHWAFEFYTEEMTLEERWKSAELPLNAKHIEQARYELSELAGDGGAEHLQELEHKYLDDYYVPRRFLSMKWHQRRNNNCAFLA